MDAHHEAVHDVIVLIESQALFTRTGEHGVAHLDGRGLIATAFDHWDTRSGDPQLHTHVVVANPGSGLENAIVATDHVDAARAPVIPTMPQKLSQATRYAAIARPSASNLRVVTTVPTVEC